MKKLISFVLAFNILNILNAEVVPKVVELHITKKELADVETTKKSNMKVPLYTTKHYTCTGGFIDNHGDILTAKHCQDGADMIEVVTSDGQYYQATIISSSPLQDLAVIHIDRRDTAYFVLASSVTQGDEISTLGSPLGLTATQSWGRVARMYEDFILMDESILPGNSGGVVFNKNEELVGCAVSVSVVLFGVTHLAQAQSVDSIAFFLRSIKLQLDMFDLSK